MPELKSLLFGKVKDKASISKARLIYSFSSKSVRYIHLALLKSTTHTSNKPPNSDYVSAVVSYTNSRHAPAAFAAALWRLRVTKNAVVAIKSLIVFHKLMKSSREKFQGQDRGWNNLKLNEFSDKSSNLGLELSPWVRWYGLYLDRLSWLSRVLGSFPSSTDSSKEKAIEKDCVSSHQTGYIMKQIDSLVSFFEQLCTRPETPPLFQNKIVDEIRELVIQDYFTVVSLVMVRFQVVRERMIEPGYDSGSNDMRPVLMRIEECKENLCGFFWRCRRLAEDFWCLIEILKAETVKDDNQMVVSVSVCSVQTMGDDEKMVEFPGFVQTEWVTFDDAEAALCEIVKWNSEWVTFDDPNPNAITTEPVRFSLYT